MKTFLSRAAVVAGASTAALLIAPTIAAAHVTVDAPGATQGGYTVLTFKVPTESETASTTKLSVELPDLSSARTEPLAGWTSVVTRNDKKQATSVTWTANPGNGVPPEQFQRFVVSVGPLPKTDDLSFKASQTYSDGTVVNWDQPENGDGSEPDHPAPSISLAAAGSGHQHADAHSTGDTEAPTAQPADEDTTARWLGGIALVIAALGAALGIGALIRRRQS
ncbi:YcnI family protein [Skermania sp. ID1734]|uniref:YcnI family copper-binding membrane protein n=1 Tax=Skermania sp. ID1734 TaxID=2597516 RepID=UPI00117FD544|nr:YcnI family protein [Skermania sp. ID1734]TSD93455.1 YcnI family protein [Skermania sp. ID1734]